ncbi:MAG: DUF2953 domain-containing protein [Ruminococcaceae bacterium]|nr:DUF2953 domain-containing protein [Oscillospiraceae bacterium]
MVALWILGILLLLILVILLIRVGVYISFGEELWIRAKAGPVTIQILPRPDKPKKPKKEKIKKEKKGKTKEPIPEKEKKGLGLTFEDIRSAVPALFESLKKGLRKTRRRLRIQPMTVSVTFGGDDPSKVAEMYGWASTGMWTLMPQIERLTRMPDPRIHLDVDYGSLRNRAEGDVGISLQIRDALAIGFAFGIPLVKWFLVFQKAKKARDKASAPESTNNQDHHKGE